MIGPAKDRRGDRRQGAPRCNALVGSVIQERCYGSLQELEHSGEVFCTQCGAIDRRSTEGNRRRAAMELAQLERRIARELHEIREQLEAGFSSVRRDL